MTETRQIIVVVITFIKSNKDSLECRVGVYQPSRKYTH